MMLNWKAFNKALFPEPNTLESVAQFHSLFRWPIRNSPTLAAPARSNLRIKLLQDEVRALEDAVAKNDLVEAADALADIQYALSGAVLEFGMGGLFLSVFHEVHRSKMSRACSSPHEAKATKRYFREHKGWDSVIKEVPGTKKWLVFRKSDGKLLKSIRYTPPNLAPMVARSRQQQQQQQNQQSSFGPLLASPGALSLVAECHSLFGCPSLATPSIPCNERCQLRIALLQAKVQKLHDAIFAQGDLVQVAASLADIQYVLSGTVLEFGMGSTFETIFTEVHRSNMSKGCTTYEEAEETRLHYLKTEETESYAEEVEPGKWLVYRQGDKKALNSVRYSPANLQQALIHS
eukprot:scaffold2619_cov129-Cylindrotheca_fusiformis.AAC.7